MNKQYFTSTEDRAWNELISWNYQHRCFEELARMPEKTEFDASGITVDGRKCAIELKVRNALLTDNQTVSSQTFNDDTLLIEQHKHSSLMMYSVVSGMTPIYINFLYNAVVVHNLTKLSHFKPFNNMKIKSLGYQKMEIGSRYGLFLDDAAVYPLTPPTKEEQ